MDKSVGIKCLRNFLLIIIKKTSGKKVFFTLKWYSLSVYYYWILFVVIIMQIGENIDLKPYNTLQIPVNSKCLVKIQIESDIIELMNSEIWKTEKHCILN